MDWPNRVMLHAGFTGLPWATVETQNIVQGQLAAAELFNNRLQGATIAAILCPEVGEDKASKTSRDHQRHGIELRGTIMGTRRIRI